MVQNSLLDDLQEVCRDSLVAGVANYRSKGLGIRVPDMTKHSRRERNNNNQKTMKMGKRGAA